LQIIESVKSYPSVLISQKVDNDSSILSVADYTGGVNTTAPIEGAGTRFMWYASKAALRAGQINGTQWDDANIGLYSTATTSESGLRAAVQRKIVRAVIGSASGLTLASLPG
jgi:hypothetical protein